MNIHQTIPVQRLLHLSIVDATTVKNNMQRLYASALENRNNALGIGDRSARAEFNMTAKPQLANTVAYSYAEMISHVLREIDPSGAVYAATSNTRGSKTSAITLLTRNLSDDGKAVEFPTAEEFWHALQMLDLSAASNKNAYQLKRHFETDLKSRAMLAPLNPKWALFPELQSYTVRDRG